MDDLNTLRKYWDLIDRANALKEQAENLQDQAQGCESDAQNALDLWARQYAADHGLQKGQVWEHIQAPHCRLRIDSYWAAIDTLADPTDSPNQLPDRPGAIETYAAYSVPGDTKPEWNTGNINIETLLAKYRKLP